MDMDVGDLTLQLKDKALFKQKCFIGGKWEEADNGEKFEVINPSNSSVVGTMPNVGKNETIKAIEAANNAWPAWKSLTGKERSIIIRRWHDLILENIF